jgi:hypothetical protein
MGAVDHRYSINSNEWFDDIGHHGFSQPFSQDGSRVFFFRRRTMEGDPDQLRARAESVGERRGELWVADVRTGQAEPFLPGFEVSTYDISLDDQVIERFLRHAAFELVLSAEIAAEVLHSLAYPRS